MLDNKVVLITGASKGLGKEISSKLLKEKCQVINLSRSSVSRKNLSTINVDLSKPLGIKLPKSLPRPNILIINAGMFFGLSLHKYTPQQIIQIINVNINGNIIILGELLKRFKNIEKIIIISSTSAFEGHPDILYGISKSALSNAYKSLRHLYKDSKIFLLELGQISNTEFTSELSDSEKKYLAKYSIRAGVKLEKERIAEVVVELALKSTLPNGVITLGDTNSWKQ